MSLFLQVRDPRGRYVELPHGPHRITLGELMRSRERFGEEVTKDPSLFGNTTQAPQTVAREILAELVPTLDTFDRLVLGFAVTNTHVRVGEAPEGPWERIP